MTNLNHLPIHLPSPSPDFNRLKTILDRNGEPDRVPFIELFADQAIMEAVINEEMPSPEIGDFALREKTLDLLIKFWYECGYDYVTVSSETGLPQNRIIRENEGGESAGRRRWVIESRGLIGDWQDLESYPWPKAEDIDYFNLEYVSKNLPDGMKIIFIGPGGIMENVMWIMGYEHFLISLKTEPDLVEAVIQKIGEFLVNLYSTSVQISEVTAVWLGDDMGFKTSTIISPDEIRKYMFPWQKKLVEITHAQQLSFLLHSCGNLRTIMDELIEDVGIDAKHSFEDTIMPAAEAKELYGDRIAILGGVDVNFLCTSSEEEVRSYTRKIIDDCAPGGGWALGTGNSVASYIPLQNYLAMLDEGRKYGKYN